MKNNRLIFGPLLVLCAITYGDTPPQTFPPGTYSSIGDKSLVASVEATVQVSPPEITLQIHNPSTYNIFRKALGAPNWGSIVHTTAPTDTTWTDTNVVAGTIYEYRVSYNVENLSDYLEVVPTGYLTIGIRVDRSTAYQGRVILCIDRSITNSLAYEIDRLRKDLAGDGWHTETLFVEHSDSLVDGQQAQLVRSNLYSIYTNAPAGDKPVAVYLLGHIPRTTSGYDVNPPDSHAVGGAKPADSYFGDLDGLWTDVLTWDTDGVKNYPGDYQWDQDDIPSDVELAVGRVDLSSLSEMGSDSEETLLRRYLDKAHAFRHAHVEPGMKVLHKDGNQITDEFAWRELIPICGLSNYQYTTIGDITADGSANEADYSNKYGPYLFFENASSIGPETPEFAAYGSQVVFWNGWQSSYWFWTRPNNLMRAGLASEGLTLGYWSSGRCGWFMQHVAMGLPVSYSLKQTMNNYQVEGPYHYQKSYIIQPQGYRDSSRRVWMNYMGDPTIRWFTVIPPANLSAQINGADVDLSWNASSAENLEGYRVFRADSPLGPFTNELTASITTNTTYTDLSAPAGDKVYMVKAVALQRTGSGTFLNPSQGITAPVYTATPWLALTPKEGVLEMLLQQASFAEEQTLSITNLGGGTFSNLSVLSNTDWLGAFLDTNTLVVTIQPNAQADSLAAGTHLGNIILQTDNADPLPIRVTLNIEEEVLPVLSTNDLSIPEGGTNRFLIHLSVNPGAPATVTVNRASGDSDITIDGSNKRIFTTNNWNVDQSVVLQAAEDDGDWLHGSAIIHCVLTGGATGTVTATEVDNDLDPSTLLPFSETFETGSDMADTPGTVHNQHGWIASGDALVQGSEVHIGTQALSLNNSVTSHAFIGNATNVVITLWSQPIFSELPPESFDTHAAAVFYVNTNGHIVAYNSTNATELSDTVVSNGWNKFEIACDYSSKVWNLSLNDAQVATNFTFYGSPASFQALELTEASRDGTSFFDSIEITDAADDSDSDGLPDSWEEQYWPGDLSHNPSDPAANPDYTVMECYIAGIDPTDENAAFLISDLQPLTSVLSWNAASGRVYSVYWTSNLMGTFTLLKNNYTGGVFTDLTHGAKTEGFYKLDVELE